MTDPTSELAAALRGHVEPRSIPELCRAHDVPKRSIYRLLRAENEPSLQLLLDAARVLGVEILISPAGVSVSSAAGGIAASNVLPPTRMDRTRSTSPQ